MDVFSRTTWSSQQFLDRDIKLLLKYVAAGCHDRPLKRSVGVHQAQNHQNLIKSLKRTSSYWEMMKYQVLFEYVRFRILELGKQARDCRHEDSRSNIFS